MGRIGFQPVPNRPDPTHSSVTLEVRTIRLQNRCCVDFRDRQDARPTASILFSRNNSVEVTTEARPA